MAAPLQEILDLARQLEPHQVSELVRRMQVDSPGLGIHVGDISATPADGLITAVNSKGLWAGARVEDDGVVYHWATENPASVDGAIQCVAGGQFHAQALILVGESERQTLVAGTQTPHRGAFQNVVFVVDDAEGPVYDLLLAGLVAADTAGLNSVSVAAMRTGVANKGGSVAPICAELARAARDFRARARHLHRITFVVNHEGEVAEGLRTSLQLSPPTYTVKVQLGDITCVPAEGLITAVNSEGMWGGAIDRAIYGAAGQQYHRSARMLLGRSDGRTLVARPQHDHEGAFGNVVFVVDDLRIPLYEILTAALRAADEAGLSSVTIPAMRMGVMMSMGGSPEEKIADMAWAALDFQEKAKNLKSLTFVIYGDPVTCEALKREIASRRH